MHYYSTCNTWVYTRDKQHDDIHLATRPAAKFQSPTGLLSPMKRNPTDVQYTPKIDLQATVCNSTKTGYQTYPLQWLLYNRTSPCGVTVPTNPNALIPSPPSSACAPRTDGSSRRYQHSLTQRSHRPVTRCGVTVPTNPLDPTPSASASVLVTTENGQRFCGKQQCRNWEQTRCSVYKYQRIVRGEMPNGEENRS